MSNYGLQLRSNFPTEVSASICLCVYVFVPAHFGGGLGLGVGMWRCVRASLGTLERASVLSAFVSHYGALPVACLHAKKKSTFPPLVPDADTAHPSFSPRNSAKTKLSVGRRETGRVHAHAQTAHHAHVVIVLVLTL